MIEKKGEVYFEAIRTRHWVVCKKRACQKEEQWYQYPDDPDRPPVGWCEVCGSWYCPRHAKEIRNA